MGMFAGVGLSIHSIQLYRRESVGIVCSVFIVVERWVHKDQLPLKMDKNKDDIAPQFPILSATLSVGYVAGEVLPVPPPANDQGQLFLQLKTTYTILRDIIHCCAAYIGIGGMKIEDEPRH
jgi:hypothetical protein